MLDSLRPRLSATAIVRVRDDGSVGIHDHRSGRSAELAADQAKLLALLDGSRTVAEIAAAHFASERFVPFVALRDLLAVLDDAGLLVGPSGGAAVAAPRPGAERKPRASPPAPRSPWVRRLAHQRLGSLPLPGARPLSILVCVALATAVFVGMSMPARALEPLDVPLFYVGAALALFVRACARVAIAGSAGPIRLEVASSFGVLHLAPDTDGVVLADRPRRALAYVGSLTGIAAVAFATSPWAGLAAGATAVLLADLCPFAPTSFGRLLATFAGKVDLREHARAYLTGRLLRRVTARGMFDGEASLLLSAALSLGWIALIVRLLFTVGVTALLRLVAVGMEHRGLERGVSYLGALVLLLLLPASLVALVAALLRAGTSLRPAGRARAGRSTGAIPTRAQLSSIPLFTGLSSEELEALARASEELRYEAGAAIVVQDAPGDRFFALRSGQVAVEVTSESGLTREVARLGPGDCFGELALLEDRPRSATVRALGPTVVTALSRDAFERVERSLEGSVPAVIRASQALNRSALFAPLPAERRSALALQLEPREANAGEEVVRWGERGDDFFLVASGTLAVLDEGGREIGRLGPGDHFGEVALLRDVPRTATVRATEATRLLRLSKDRFIRALAQDLPLSSRLEALAAERLEERS